MEEIENKDNKNKILFIIALAVVFVVASGIIGYFLGQSSMQRYKDIVDELYPESPEEIYSFSGTVLSVSENSLIVKTTEPGRRFLPTEELEYVEMLVNVNEDTEIVSFSLSLNLDGNFQEKTQISLSEISEGDSVSISSSENMVGETEVTAVKIEKIVYSFKI